MTKETIATVKALPILRVAEELSLHVRKKRALCFNHDDHDPSLTFDDKKQSFRCYVCDFKGDNITLVGKKLGLSFLDACIWIIQRFQIQVDEQYKVSKFRYKKQQTIPKIITKDIPSPFQPNPEIYEWLINELTLSSGAADYLLRKRGFSEQIIKDLEIRDVINPDEVFHKLSKHWGTEALINCGLLKLDDSSKVKKIWWDHVIIFPFTDLNHRIAYLQARRMCADPGKYKYLALSQLKPFIYNINVLTQLAEGDNLFICEGVPDTITAMELKMPAIGVLGASSFDHDVVDLLLKYRINIFPDTDPAGQLFVHKVRQAFYEKGKTIQERTIPKPYKDLNEYFIAKNSRPQ